MADCGANQPAFRLNTAQNRPLLQRQQKLVVPLTSSSGTCEHSRMFTIKEQQRLRTPQSSSSCRYRYVRICGNAPRLDTGSTLMRTHGRENKRGNTNVGSDKKTREKNEQRGRGVLQSVLKTVFGLMDFPGRGSRVRRKANTHEMEGTLERKTSQRCLSPLQKKKKKKKTSSFLPLDFVETSRMKQ